MVKQIFIWTLPIIFFTSCASWPTRWYKGNLHTHSLWSDGDDFPEMICGWYADHGYHFLGLSDHNILQEGDKWVSVPEGSPKYRAFEKYLIKYGQPWVETKESKDVKEVRLKTLYEYAPLFDRKGKFLLIRCEEITSGFERKPVHINATNVQGLIQAQQGESVLEVMQNTINAIHNIRKTTGQMIMPHINHPNFGWGIHVDDMIALDGERFFEVYNGHPQVYNQGDSIHLSTELMWDIINANYVAESKPLLLGLATDDSHHYHQRGPELSNTGRGWVMVKSRQLTAESLISAMEGGQFYASTGVKLMWIKQNQKKLQLKIKEEAGVTYMTTFIGAKDQHSGPVIFAEISGTNPAYEFTGQEWFVRATVTSSKMMDHPVLANEKQKAWIPPVIVNPPAKR